MILFTITLILVLYRVFIVKADVIQPMVIAVQRQRMHQSNNIFNSNANLST